MEVVSERSFASRGAGCLTEHLVLGVMRVEDRVGEERRLARRKRSRTWSVEGATFFSSKSRAKGVIGAPSKTRDQIGQGVLVVRGFIEADQGDAETAHPSTA